MLMKIRRFGCKRQEVTGNWRTLHSEEPHDLHSLSNVVLVIIKEDKMGSTCGMSGGEEKCIWGIMKIRDHLDGDRRIILKWILNG
jgi:hypothetical protein